MLKELFDKVLETGKACGPRVINADREPGHIYYLDYGDGKPRLIEAQPQPICAELLSLSAVADFVIREGSSLSAVWYSRSGVVAILDHCVATAEEESGEIVDTDIGTRREGGSLFLRPSAQMLMLADLAKTKVPFDQRKLILLLRSTFTDCLVEAAGLIDVLRSVKFEAGTTAEGNIGRQGNASVGKSLRTQVSGTAEIPEQVTLVVPAFEGPILPRSKWVRVRMVLDADAGSATFQFYPVAGDLDAAWYEAEMHLRVELDALLSVSIDNYAPGADDGRKPRLYHGLPFTNSLAGKSK